MTKEEIKKLIEDRINLIRAGYAKNYLLLDSSYPMRARERDRKKIEEEIARFKQVYEAIISHAKSLKVHISDITEKTELCASYLIYGKIANTWEAIFILASQGLSFEVMELARSIVENLDLINLFNMDKSGKYLEKWYQGNIVDNVDARKLMDDFIREGRIQEVEQSGLSPYELSTLVYKVLSKYTHCSYVALLDLVDVFHHDFDWEKNAGFHYTLNNMHVLESTMCSTIISFKLIYLKLKDHANFKKMDKLLSEFGGPHDENELKELTEKINKQKPI